MNKNQIIKNYSLLYFGFLVYSFVSVFAKFASKQNDFYHTLLFIGLELFVLFVYAIIWQQVLKKFQLMVAASNKGVTVVFTLLWSFLFFGEKISFLNIVGAILIILGIWMVSSDV